MIYKIIPTDDDLKTIMHIWLNSNIATHAYIPKTYWQDNYAAVEGLIPSADVYVFKDETAIKGFIGIVEEHYIAGIFVEEVSQGKGIGQQLLNHCKHLYDKLELHVYAKNEKAINFYLKNGFRQTDTSVNSDTNEIEHMMSWENPLLV